MKKAAKTVKKTSLQTIRHSLFSRKRYLQKDENKIESQTLKGLGRSCWILSRGLCLYQAIHLKNIPPAERSAALEIHLQQASPWQKYGSCVLFNGETAQTWLWDEKSRSTAAQTANATTARPLPETLLLPKPKTNGAFLRQTLSGYELQYWQEGSLLLSNWWPHPPTEEEMSRTLIMADFPPQKPFSLPPTPQAPKHPGWLNTPWGQPVIRTEEGGKRAIFFSQASSWAALLLLATTLAFSSFYGVRLTTLKKAIDKAEATRKELTRNIQPILDARAIAVADLNFIANIDTLIPHPPLTLAFAEVIQILKPTPVRLKFWRFTQPTLQLELDSQKGKINQSLLITAFEKSTFFQGVRAEKSKAKNTLTLSMTILPTSKENTP